MTTKTFSASVARLVLAVVAPALFAGTACAKSASEKESTGQQLYFAHGCYGCHGYTGETGERVLVGSGILSSEQLFVTFLRLRANQNPLTPTTNMPNYSQASLSDADARKLYAYIKTFKSTAPAAGTIPAFKAIVDAAARR